VPINFVIRMLILSMLKSRRTWGPMC